jgi:hypothetical protein
MCAPLVLALVLLPSYQAAFAQTARDVPSVTVLTRELLEKFAADKRESRAREEAGLTPLPDDDPAYTEKYQAFLARIDDLSVVARSYSSSKPAPNVNDAIYLVDLLSEDMGHPGVNPTWQNLAVIEIREAASRQGVDADVLNVLRQGLIDYAATGGGVSSPFSEMELAKGLTVVGGPGHPEADEQASKLIEQARAHAAELQSDLYWRFVEDGEKAIQTITRRENTPKAVLQQQAWTEADQALRVVALGDQLSVLSVKRVARLATTDFGDAAANEDMIARLLIAYRLRLENRKGLKQPVIAAIENRLLWLAEKKTCKLTSERHWTLWARAVGAIPRRAVSHDMQGFLRKSEKAKEDRSLSKAAADAQGRLRRQ